MAGLKPYHHFFLTTAIHRNSFDACTKRVFWPQNITHTHAFVAGVLPQTPLGNLEHFPALLAGWGGMSGEGEREGRERKRKGKGGGEDNRSIPVMLFPTLSPASSE